MGTLEAKPAGCHLTEIVEVGPVSAAVASASASVCVVAVGRPVEGEDMVAGTVQLAEMQLSLLLPCFLSLADLK